jgi:hypothetical protein
MANKRNIAALIQALRGSPGLPVGIPLEALARHLADAEVLAPVVTFMHEDNTPAPEPSTTLRSRASAPCESRPTGQLIASGIRSSCA